MHSSARFPRAACCSVVSVCFVSSVLRFSRPFETFFRKARFHWVFEKGVGQPLSYPLCQNGTEKI
jgi:hypothetical protein